MESIKYYKLHSQYPEDVTKDCKLTMTEIDENFLTFKDNDISAATYDSTSMLIHIVKNNGDKLVLDLSDIKDTIKKEVEKGIAEHSGDTSGGTIHLTGELDENGVLTLDWLTIKNSGSGGTGSAFASISSVVVPSQIYHSESFWGNGTKEAPLRLSNLATNGVYNNVLGIVETLPTSNLKNGDRYITIDKISNFGCLYNEQGMHTIDQLLKDKAGVWRLPTKSDWDKLLNYCEPCDTACKHGGSDVGGRYGKVAGKVLKSIDFWEGKENLDKYGFTAYPVGISNEESELTDEHKRAQYWTSTNYHEDSYFIKGFISSADTITQDASIETNKYGIRLVADNYSGGSESFVNLFGQDYDVIVFHEINQMWIGRNLDYYIDELRCDRFEYDEATVKEVKVINHWNGDYWEKQQIHTLDCINLVNNDKITQYTVNTQNSLIKQKTIETDISGNTLTKIDSGWY